MVIVAAKSSKVVVVGGVGVLRVVRKQAETLMNWHLHCVLC